MIAPARAIDQEFLLGLGASEVPERGTVPEGVDALIDLVSGDAASFAANAATLRAGGHASSAAAGDRRERGRTATRCTPRRTRPASPGSGALIDSAPACACRSARAFNFGEIPAALAALGEHKQGKLSVV